MVTVSVTQTKSILMDAWLMQDDLRPRSQQVEVGPSSLGGCRRQVVYTLLGTEPVAQVERLPSLMGTSIHENIEKALSNEAIIAYLSEKYGLDPGDIMPEVEAPGIPGLIGPAHVDLYQRKPKIVTDWKSSKKYNAKKFPKLQQRWQVQTYGYLLNRAGMPVEGVELVLIPRDGMTKDILVHSEPYDEGMALEALEWQKYNVQCAETEYLPPGNPAFKVLCTDYCPYFGPTLCPGKGSWN